MGLAEHTSRVVSQFEFSDEDLNRHVQEYLKQTSKLSANSLGRIGRRSCVSSLLTSLQTRD